MIMLIVTAVALAHRGITIKITINLLSVIALVVDYT
jgi:hypothetical protein